MEDIQIRHILNKEEFKTLNQHLINWDWSTVEGRGQHDKRPMRGYGHVEIKIYQSTGIIRLFGI